MEKNEKAWKVLRTEYLIKRPWLTARRDDVELPDGRSIPEYYVLEYPDWVNVIAITKDGYFVMELSANPSTMTNLAHCFLATGVEKVSEQHLDPTEDLSVHLLTREEVLNLLRNNEMMQSLMVAPLLKYLSKEL